MTRDPSCWACCLWPANEHETAASFAARLAANHMWTGGQHIYGSGMLRLPWSPRERWRGSLVMTDEPIRPILPPGICRRCGAGKVAGQACRACQRRTVRIGSGRSA